MITDSFTSQSPKYWIHFLRTAFLLHIPTLNRHLSKTLRLNFRWEWLVNGKKRKPGFLSKLLRIMANAFHILSFVRSWIWLNKQVTAAATNSRDVYLFALPSKQATIQLSNLTSFIPYRPPIASAMITAMHPRPRDRIIICNQGAHLRASTSAASARDSRLKATTFMICGDDDVT